MSCLPFTIANSYNLTFYLLTSTWYAGSGSFCKELSNDPVWIHVAADQWNTFSTFKAYIQGRAIQSVIEKGPAKKKKLSDTIRTKLREELNILLGNWVFHL
jgi:hypothetical protein